MENNNRNGFIIVSRAIDAQRFGPKVNFARTPILGLSHDDVADRYCGLDRVSFTEDVSDEKIGCLPDDGVFDLTDYEMALYIFTKNFSVGLDLIYVGHIYRPKKLPEPFQFRGYDFGYYHTIYNYYSVILNEVIYGLEFEMREFGVSLNNSLLFTDLEAVNRLRATRLVLLKRGADLEDDDACTAIGIWRYQR